jgi:hypothetical protein
MARRVSRPNAWRRARHPYLEPPDERIRPTSHPSGRCRHASSGPRGSVSAPTGPPARYSRRPFLQRWVSTGNPSQGPRPWTDSDEGRSVLECETGIRISSLAASARDGGCESYPVPDRSANLIPTPPGIGAPEVTTVAAMAAVGVKRPPATAAILVYRVISGKGRGLAALGPFCMTTSTAATQAAPKLKRPPT